MAQLDLLAKWIYSKFGFYATPRTNRNTKSNMTAETNEMASLEPVLKKLSELAPRPEKLTILVEIRFSDKGVPNFGGRSPGFRNGSSGSTRVPFGSNLGVVQE